MSGSSFDLDPVDRLTVGTVGEPGQRVFYLQARQGAQLVTLKVEKAQVAALSEQLGALLHDAPPTTPVPEPSDLGLEEPVLAEWAVSQMGLAFAEDIDEVTLVFEELPREEDDEPAGAFSRIVCSRAQAAALVIRGALLVQSGRPVCPLCGYPLDPRGHTCPRTNGHRPPLV